jgi:hypothetical protein
VTEEGKAAETESGAIERARIDLAVAFYASARDELVARVRQRDAALFLYLAAAATLFSLALSGRSGASSLVLLTLFAVPLLGLGASQIYAHHYNVTSSIARYLRHELEDYVRDKLSADAPPQWDSSKALIALPSVLNSALHSLVLLLAPQVLAIVIVDLSNVMVWFKAAGTTVGVYCVGHSAFVLWRTYKFRKVQAEFLQERRRARDVDNEPSDSPSPGIAAAP